MLSSAGKFYSFYYRFIGFTNKAYFAVQRP